MVRENNQTSPPIYRHGTEVNRFIASSIHYFPKQGNVATYEENEGTNAVYLARLGYQVTVYDSSTNGLEKVQLLAKMNEVSVTLKKIDLVKDMPPGNTYDGSIMVFGHFHHHDQLQVLDKIMCSIKENGVFIFEVYEYAQLLYNSGGPTDMSYLYNAEEILRWARRYKLKHYFTGEVEQLGPLIQTNTRRVIQVIVEK